jgi:WD40 repeat protein
MLLKLKELILLMVALIIIRCNGSSLHSFKVEDIDHKMAMSTSMAHHSSSTAPAAPALSVAWTFGFNKDIINGVHSLTTDDRNALFTVSSHSGIIYDFEHRRQTVLQGHCNQVSCCTVSNDKRWIVTGDYGEDSIMVVWDSKSGVPVKTVFSPHVGGVTAVDISSDSLFIVSVGSSVANGSQQDIAIWAWTNESDSPVLRQEIVSSDRQHAVKFDSQDQSAVVTTGQSTVFFWTWQEYFCEGYCARVTKSEFGYFSGLFTATLFLSGTGNAITSTSDGYVVFWESQSSTLASNGKRHNGPVRSASKVLRLVECGINTMITTANTYLAIGCADGSIRFYDFFLRLEAWFEDLSAGPITSVTLGSQRCPYPDGEAGAPGLRFWVPDFLAGTSDSFVLGIEASAFDEVRVEDRRGTLLLQGLGDEVSSITCHPHRPLVALCCANGSLHVWDYDLKLLMNLREFNDTTTSKTKHNQDPRPTLKPTAASFSPSGDMLVVGFSCGAVKFLNCNTFEDLSSFSPSTDAVCALKFSSSGAYLGGYDGSNHVMIFQR